MKKKAEKEKGNGKERKRKRIKIKKKKRLKKWRVIQKLETVSLEPDAAEAKTDAAKTLLTNFHLTIL